MSCMVLDLQKNAIDEQCAVATLLRRALVVAIKLNSPDTESWLRKELNGYESSSDSEIPAYRHYKSLIQGYDHNSGWQTICFPEPDFEKRVLEGTIHQSLPELESLVGKRDAKGFLELNMTGWQKQFINQSIRNNVLIRNIIPIPFVVKIFNIVRNKILDWAMEMEQKGIMGDKMIFSDKEKQLAQNINIHIEQMNGNLGDIINSVVSQEFNTNIKKGSMQELEDFLRNQGISKEDIEQLKTTLEKNPQQTKSGHFCEEVSSWIRKIVNKAYSGCLSISADMAGIMITKAINGYYGA